jgi:hypothetical protein
MKPTSMSSFRSCTTNLNLVTHLKNGRIVIYSDIRVLISVRNNTLFLCQIGHCPLVPFMNSTAVVLVQPDAL